MRKFFLFFFLLLNNWVVAEEPIRVELVSEQTAIQPGEPFRVGLLFTMDGEWHIYSDDPRNPSPSPEIDWSLPDGFRVEPLRFPLAKSFDTAGIPSWGYEKQALLTTTITPPDDLSSPVILKGEVDWIGCELLCVPGSEQVELTLPVTTSAIPKKSQFAPLFPAIPNGNSEVDSLWLALFFAFVGGLILNLMPCVLPVISLKVMSFINMTGESRWRLLQHGLLFTLGVLVSFWALASLLLILQASGEAVGWGFQLQEPRFVALLAIILFVLGLSMVGVFELGLSVAAKAGSMEHSGSAFWGGVLATSVATPCTGPFLGPVLGYAVTVGAFSSLLIFTSMGLGMAAPYLLLSAFPALTERLPKPGPWMITFKQAMGILMLASVTWLVWVFGAQTDNDAVFALLLSLVLIGTGCWIFGRWGQPTRKGKWHYLVYVWIALFVGLGLNISQSAARFHSPGEPIYDEESVWEPYSDQRLQDLRDIGTPVFIDFTAKWCILCQANEVVFANDTLNRRFEELGVVRMKADWTRMDASITRAIRSYGRNGVPLYVLHPGDPTKEVIILPQTLTPSTVLDALNSLEEKK